MAGRESERPIYPIGVVQQLTGLSGRQIRYYEQKGLLKAARSGGGRRLFTPGDVRTLLEIKAALAGGASLDALREAAGKRRPAETASLAQSRDLEVVRNYFQETRGPTSVYPIDRREQLIETIDELRQKGGAGKGRRGEKGRGP
ncbi:MAG TPA: MerR family transcriptional regulator [Bacillota bacterium]|nr:MerR family transcriptional regulator [Bacillota bacterium]